MTAEDNKQAHLFEEQLQRLIILFKDQRERIGSMARQQQELQEEIARLQNENESLKQQYANLKTAKMIALNDGDIAGAKERLLRLVCEIDQCIAQLEKTDEIRQI